METTVTQQFRSQILDFMADHDLVPHEAKEVINHREDGVEEFRAEWRVRGDYQQGVFASLSDIEDQIEFGLLERSGNVATNLLNVTVVLYDDSDMAVVLSSSDYSDDMNYEAQVFYGRHGRLDDALRHFQMLMGGARE